MGSITVGGWAGLRTARWAAVGVLAVAFLAGAPAQAEYNCMPGIAIPGGVFAATYNINAPGCYWLANNRTMTGGGPAIQINASHVFLDLRGHTVRHNVGGAVIISNAVGGAITDIHVANGKLTGAQGGTGVSFTGCPNGDFNISDLVIADTGVGIPGIGILIGGGGATTPAHAVIARNMIDTTRTGILLDLVNGGRIEDNVVIGRISPIALDTGIRLGDCSGNDVRGNTISDFLFGIGYGIHLVGGSNYNNVQHNTISNCREGIRVENSDCNAIDWNVANGNQVLGIDLMGTSANNVYGFNRASGACTASGTGLFDNGSNVNAGNNF